jgi:lipoyl(octanoyl) transferase
MALPGMDPDLMHYQGIVPCGLKEFPVTSLKAEGIDVPISEVIEAMQRNLPDFFHA